MLRKEGEAEAATSLCEACQDELEQAARQGTNPMATLALWTAWQRESPLPIGAFQAYQAGRLRERRLCSRHARAAALELEDLAAHWRSRAAEAMDASAEIVKALEVDDVA